MPGPYFFQTMMGRKFYESDVPRTVKALESIASSLEQVVKPSLAKALFDGMSKLVDQIDKCNPVDEMGHPFKMNDAYVNAKKAVDGVNKILKMKGERTDGKATSDSNAVADVL